MKFTQLNNARYKNVQKLQSRYIGQPLNPDKS